NDDPIGTGLLDDRAEMLERSEERITNRGLVGGHGVIHHAEDGVPATRHRLDFRDEVPGERAGAKDQDTLARATEAADAATHRAQPEQEADEDEEARHERFAFELRLRDEAGEDAHGIRGFVRSRRRPREAGSLLGPLQAPG